MRSREEIEWFYNELDRDNPWEYRLYKQNEAILEVLLDIRDLLNKQEDEIRPNS